jgi:hypothetical protein
MKTPREKYIHDDRYHALVDSLYNAIRQAQFTPSEVREAAILACIIYEETRVIPPIKKIPPGEVVNSIKNIHNWLDEQGY